MTDSTPLFLSANYHTHTVRCHHAFGEDREYVEQAIASGMKILGFSDHVPQAFPADYIPPNRMLMSGVPEYTESLCRLREEYKNDIQILIGYEMEYYPTMFRETMKGLCSCPIDYLILGQHFIGTEIGQPYCGAPTDSEDRLMDYVDTVIEALHTGVFSYLAHPDLMPFTGDEAVYEKHMRRLCRAAKELSIPLEINLLGLSEDRAYPSKRFWNYAREEGNAVIVGCDAHRPSLISDPAVRCKATAFCEACGLHPSQDLHILDPHNY